jgi:uncharacterized membrane protein YfcA
MTLSLHDFALLVAALLAAGAVMGVLSGMLGIGGGGVLVPVLYETFGFLGVDPAIRMQMSVGTSLAVVGVTSWRTFTSHRARGSVDVALLQRLGPSFVVGVVLGVVFARNAGGTALKWAWVIFGSLMATKLAFGRESWRLGNEIPKSRIVELYAAAVGFVSVLLSIAGAAYMVTLMTLYGRPILQAVGTSSGFGPLVSIPGVIGFVWAGWQATGTPAASLGYVNLLGAALILPASLALAPVGVRIAHGISKRTLEIAFAVFLYIVVLRFLASLLGLTG